MRMRGSKECPAKFSLFFPQMICMALSWSPKRKYHSGGMPCARSEER